MIDNIIKAATCCISCGEEIGSGYLITDCHVLTARHCVLEAIETGKGIELTFPDRDEPFAIPPSNVLDHSIEMDACILALPESLGCSPIPLSTELPREGNGWRSFGYPKGKTQIGHRIEGTISHVLDAPRLRMDIDLTIEQDSALEDYRGFSGSSVVSENVSIGMIRLKIDGTLGAISLLQLEEFLEKNGIVLPSSTSDEVETVASGNDLADRSAFQETFEQKLARCAGDYVFLEGAHGIGKTTFCSEFTPEAQTLFSLGSYSFTSQGHGPSNTYRTQPDVFFDWLSTTISSLLTGEASRKEERSYATMVQDTSMLLEQFSKYSESSHRQGVLFLDGINEAQTADPDALTKLIGLFPQVLPQSITIVLTAPNYQSIASTLPGKVKGENVISLPPLTEGASKNYCWQELDNNKATPTLVARIYEKAQGHPLYLRYLIEHVNNSDEEATLEDFPTFSGSIEQYYESLWPKLLEDAQAINLLAIIARLRWGLEKRDFTKVLTQVEQAVFVSTYSRIRHLLLDSDTTTIYHPSFTEYLISKTFDLEEAVQKRLACFCSEETQLDYCAQNIIFHLLRSDETDRSQAIVECDQSWVNTCVELGVEPDTLLSDIEDTLAYALNNGPSAEMYRLLLLSQRVSFRYNTLFAQSARLIAEALISLQKPREALKHVVRYNTLIVDPQEAFLVAFRLIQYQYFDEALELLEQLREKILEDHLKLPKIGSVELSEYIFLCRFHLKVLCATRHARGTGGMYEIIKATEHFSRILDATLAKKHPEKYRRSLGQITCIPPAYLLCLHDTYASLAQIEERFQVEVRSPEIIYNLIWILFTCEEFFESYGLPRKVEALHLLFSDIEELATKGFELDRKFASKVLGVLICLGAPTSVVELFAKQGEEVTPQTLKIRGDNGVDTNFSIIHSDGDKWRTKAFLDDEFSCPLVGLFDRINWLTSLDQLTRALFWCEGKARRAKADESETLRTRALELLKTRVLEPLNFSLAQRVTWQDCYATPEDVFPFLYEQITVVLMDCYPAELSTFLENLLLRAEDQCGLYSEGFREVMFAVIDKLTVQELEPALSDKIFELLQYLKNYILGGIENRHELVPEILRTIPLFVKMGSNEVAQELYRNMLSVSMGPTWYKEDQLGLMISALKEMPQTDNVQKLLPSIAGYLERASGEMTFQRYVRHEKQRFVGELVRRGKYTNSCRYFKRQVCGTTTELLSEAQQGIIDKPSPMVGMRYPGGAIEEQHAILEIVRNTEEVEWRLRWALLETYQFGDERYLDDYATEYARLINAAGVDETTVSEMVRRMEFVVGAETDPIDRTQFLSQFSKILNDSHHGTFSQFITESPNSKFQSVVSEQLSGDTTTSSLSSEDEDAMYFPGFFGRRSASREADEILEIAESHLRKQNIADARKQAQSVLKTLQAGGWNIWGDLSGGSSRAEDLLRKGTNDAYELISYYAPLIEAERYTPKWRVAEHLITKTRDLLSEEERSQLLENVLDHVRLMVGNCDAEIAEFNFLSEEPSSDSPLEIFKLILWLVDHPHWLRREQAAGMIAWLIECEPAYFEEAAKEAFSMTPGYGPDIVCGIFDEMSSRQPEKLWDRMHATVDLDYVVQNCRHVGRVAVLHRIAERAGNINITNGAETASQIKELFRSGEIELGIGESKVSIPKWADCISRELEGIEQLGILSKELISGLEENLLQICAPLSVIDCWELENTVSRCFRDALNRPLNRWEAKVRFALNTVLFPYVTKNNFSKIEQKLRIYNPSIPERTLTPGFSSSAKAIINAISTGERYVDAIGDTDNYFLNYQEVILNSDEQDISFIDILAVIVPDSFMMSGDPPTTNASFGPTEVPCPKSVPTPFETCCYLEYGFAYFGTFTPAVPLQSFTRLINADNSDYLRINWRNGRSSGTLYFGHPIQEGCLLAVKRTSVSLPKGYKLAWIVSYNGEIVTMVDLQTI